MTAPINYQRIKSVADVLHFVVMDGQYRIIQASDRYPEPLAGLIAGVKENMAAISSTGFEHAVFKRSNGQDIFIFNIGNDCLGVVKQRQADSRALFKAIEEILKLKTKKN
jgi:hypothetical protein